MVKNILYGGIGIMGSNDVRIEELQLSNSQYSGEPEARGPLGIKCGGLICGGGAIGGACAGGVAGGACGGGCVGGGCLGGSVGAFCGGLC